jgi:DNA-binding NarL/FixJ family response regulator
MTDHEAESSLHFLVPVALFGGIAFMLGADMASDWHAGHSALHLSLEALAGLLALAGVGLFVRHARELHRHAAALDRDLSSCRAEADRWRSEAQQALRGLGAQIDRQFERWELTTAEREVGLLLLQGLSHKEIAARRQTGVGTVRQQALAIYQKSQVGGRAGLAAFFLRDLRLPIRGAG